MNRVSEFQWISDYLAPLAGTTSFGLKDDAATLTVADGHDLVVTQDTIAEGVHFLTSDPLDTVAQKALRVNVSDIIAKGAAPFAYSMSLGMPDKWRDADMALFCKGLARDQAHYGMTLNGGDTYRSSQKLSISITMFGSVPKGRYVSRLGAQVGDAIFISGSIGNAALGLQFADGRLAVDAKTDAELIDWYRVPKPPFGLETAIAQFASASMDVSDGFLGDLRKLCSASQVAADVEMMNIPTTPSVQAMLQRDGELQKLVWGGGDDYQCLMTVPDKHVEHFRAEVQKTGHVVTQLGKICEGEAGLVSITVNGVPSSSEVESFTHF